jgi:hypothetical protein
MLQKTPKWLIILIAVIIVAIPAAIIGLIWLPGYLNPVETSSADTSWITLPDEELTALREKQAEEAEAAASAASKKAAEEEYEATHDTPSKGMITIESCLIEDSYVMLHLTCEIMPKSDDAQYHVFAQAVYESGTEGTEVAAEAEGTEIDLSFALGSGTADSMLDKKFVVCVLSDGEYIAVSGSHDITNPEAAAYKTTDRNDNGKKGILPAASMLSSSELANLGTDQCLYNVKLGNLCSGSGIDYAYNGKTYSFSSSVINELDIVVSRLNSQGIQVTFVLLVNSGCTTLIHPESRSGSAYYYAFNTADSDGVALLSAIASFLADRYSGGAYGTVDNWIVGNEINARGEWHYMSDIGATAFTDEYAKAFRIFYNGIKSTNANARVYISLDQQWSVSQDTSKYYTARDVLQIFNDNIALEGNIDWHVAIHPYDVPLTDPKVWASSASVTHSNDTAVITMQNIDVLTDFLGQDDFLSNGEVRSVLCSEVGYTSTSGQETQAAAVVYSYLQCMANQHIDGIILSRELDDSSEVAQGLSLGIYGKTAWTYYKNIDTDDAQTYIDKASATIGVDDMTTLLTER